jgi:EmrB/QacA subfamily drug resistance transporter
MPVGRPTSDSSRIWTLVACILGSSLVFIDGTVVSIALPVLQRDFGATAAQTQWVVEGYTLVLGALMLLCGALADRYGRKRVFVAGVVVFGAGSLACALAPSMHVLVAARVFQAIGGTMLAPASLAILSDCFTGEARGKAIGTWSAFTAITAAIGPIAGGVLLDHAGWRWIFGINIPLAAIVVVLSVWHVRESRDVTLAGPLDILGSLLVTGGLGCVVYAFIAASLAGWQGGAVRETMVAGIALLVAFAAWESRIPHPLLPRALFASRAFSGINVMTFLLYGALGALFYFLPFELIQVDRYSATIAGAAILPFIALIVALSRFSGGLVYRIGARATLTLGSVVIALGYATVAVLGNLPYWQSLFPATIFIGVGMGLTVAPLTTTVMESVPAPEIGLASGFNNAVSRVAGLLAIAVFGFLLAGVFNARLDARLATASLRAPVRAQVASRRYQLAGATVSDPIAQQFLFSSYTDGFRSVALVCALLACISAGTALSTLGRAKSAA